MGFNENNTMDRETGAKLWEIGVKLVRNLWETGEKPVPKRNSVATVPSTTELRADH